MKDHDFACQDHGTTATITTNNWAATRWIRQNVPEAEGTVVGGVYATITGEPKFMLDIALAMIEAGFSCANHELLEPKGSA